MRAISYDHYGDASVLSSVDIDSPSPGAGQVRVSVRAAGVNPIDVKLRSGLFSQGRPLAKPRVPGSEAAGVVDEVGPGVTGVREGEEVVGWCAAGGYAEYAVLSTYAAKPAALTWPEAVAVPVAGEAARRALTALGMRAGETLLVNGASGNVGTIAVQLAVRAGANVIGTAGPANQDYVAGLGALATTHGGGLAERVRALASQGVDAVLDAAGHGMLPEAVALRGGKDRIVTLADPEAFEMGIPFLSGTAEDQTAEVLEELLGEVAARRVLLPEPRPFPLEQAADAQRAMERSGGRGKILLVP